MTEFSQNGFVAGDRTLIETVTVPGTSVQLPVRKGSPGALLIAAAARWHREVEPLVTPGCWGYAFREVRGSTTELSNHASGTAIDLNAPLHPLGTEPAHNFTPAQIAAVRRIVADSRGTLRWGGDYIGRKDGMHLEVIGTEAACAAALPFLMTVLPPTAPMPTIPEDDMPLTQADADLIVRTLLNTQLTDLYPDKPTTTMTVAATLQWAAANAGRALTQVQRLQAEPVPGVSTHIDYDDLAAAILRQLLATAGATK